ncbi:response regulator [Paenibacillus tritici]|uniref:response regulator transcription factor n=1 Tax=Paenibacillus tritici TaxID=1873425 RepID=UPI001BAD9D02|nr:response regulator [Paenibacillus tritici]QUL52789.1 response regulator [Paenibacillus tritici]
MIRAVVVDNERLVRKGFISLIDWASFGMVITGEAGDGNAALDLLRKQETDLLFVDISMPGMTGFELIRQVRLQYPAVRCVVLTRHHEFDYVQEALRLGAVDYIVKTLLEAENADETIRRLVERIKWEDGNRGVLAGLEQKVMTVDKALLYVPLMPDLNEEQLLALPLVKNSTLHTMPDMWLSPLLVRMDVERTGREQAALLGTSWATALLEGVCDQPLKEIAAVLEQSVLLALFYDTGGQALTRLHYGELQALAMKQQQRLAENGGGSSLALVKALNLRWTLERREWELFTGGVLSQQPDQEAVAEFGRELLRCWSRLLLTPEEAQQLKLAAESNRSWRHWTSWLRQFSAHVQQRMIELGMSKEVLLCLITAVRYMKSHAGNKITQGDVAAAIHMSRGYFSRCFARFAGESFGESLRGMRLELAKSLLLETHVPVCEIACQSGFGDDRYFSKLFREHVGKLPSEYRAEGTGSGEPEPEQHIPL